MDVLGRAAERRSRLIGSLDPVRQKGLGQFFTPPQVASIMARMVHLPASGTLHVLDPGAGCGMLSAALVEHALTLRPDLDLRVTTVETDPSLIHPLAQTMQELQEAGARTQVVEADFIPWALGGKKRFDLVIQNPPYSRIRSGSPVDTALKAAGIKVPNTYAAFMALGLRLLRPEGQQVAIAPRSWMNGTYFSAFRQMMTQDAGIDALHLFGSRSEVFRDVGVLQETAVVSSVKGRQPGSVRVTASASHLDRPTCSQVPAEQVIADDVVFVPASESDAQAVAWMRRTASRTLTSLGLSVSTGKVVRFRWPHHLLEAPVGGAAPLVYQAHLAAGGVRHPADLRRPQWLKVDETSSGLLLPAGTYVLVKRFTAKEQRRRLEAATWTCSGPSAIDNRLSYLHAGGSGLDPVLAKGLAKWFSSRQVDAYFRVFSGHTQVNASDLRRVPVPSRQQVMALGLSDLPADEAVEQVVARKAGHQ